MLCNICMSAVAMSLRWANRGPWASCKLLHMDALDKNIPHENVFPNDVEKRVDKCFT